jgi:hypothetical protein
MFGGARLLATRPCVGSGFRDRQSLEAGPRRGFLFRTGAPFPPARAVPKVGAGAAIGVTEPAVQWVEAQMQIQVALENGEIAACQVIKRTGINHDIGARTCLVEYDGKQLRPLCNVARGESGRPSGHRARRAGLKTSKVVRGVAASLSTAQLTYSMRGDDLRFVVFCFAKAEYAKVFCEEFNGEMLPTTGEMKRAGAGPA